MTKSHKKIMVFGAFDILHPGHIDFLVQAKSLGSYLIVSVARDENINKVKNTYPVFNEQERLSMIKSLSMVDEVVLGSKDDPLGHIAMHEPDILALGYDQGKYVDDLEEKLIERGLAVEIIRLKPHGEDEYKSSTIRKKIEKWINHINS